MILASRDCELACDEGVLILLGEEQAQAYGGALIEMAAASYRRQALLRCEAGLSLGKKELTERIIRIGNGKRRTGILMAALAILCGAGLAACAFGGAKEEPEMGRYVESAIDLGRNSAKEFISITQNGKEIRLISKAGTDVLSSDGGTVFESVDLNDMPAGTIDLYKKYLSKITGSMEGARLYTEYTSQTSAYSTYLISAKGEKMNLEVLGDIIPGLFYSNGSFYIFRPDIDTNRYYRLDPNTGEMQLLFENQWNTSYMVADENYLYLVGRDGLLLYDLKADREAEKQDGILSSFLVENLSASEDVPIMLYPYKNGVYILVHRGIYWHELYGETIDQVIDGGFCSIGDVERHFTGIALLETENEPEFLVLYNEKEIMRYTYDASLPTVPEALRVYSVYEDSQVIRAVNSFRARHPEIPVLYESGINAESGMTVDDALKNLATDIASGNGPDILVMDDIPFDSYVEKGVLTDLSDLREGMTAEGWFVNVIDAFARDEKLYAVPMTFAVPVLAGKEEKISGLETLSDLADMLEQEKAGSEKAYVFCVWNAYEILHLLAQSSQGAWMTGEELNREAITEFLTQAKRIYDIQYNEDLKSEYYFTVGKGTAQNTIIRHNTMNPSLWIGDYMQYPLARRFDSDGIFSMSGSRWWNVWNHWNTAEEGEIDCYAGFVGFGERDYMLFDAEQGFYGENYTLMPGQRYGTCLASSILAVNSGTKYKEESRVFLEYAISTDFFTEDSFNGTPVNREAYLAKQIKLEDRPYKYNGFGSSGPDFGYVEVGSEYPDEDDYRKMDNLLDSITGVNICDPVVFDAVMEYGEKAVAGECSIEEAVDSIEKRVKLYLAE